MSLHRRQTVVSLLQRLANGSCTCPAHSNPGGGLGAGQNAAVAQNLFQYGAAARAVGWNKGTSRRYATPVDLGSVHQTNPQKEYAFETAAANVRFGEGVTQEVGMDLANLKSEHVAVLTDATLAKLPVMKRVIESLDTAGIKYSVYDTVKVEPTQVSWMEAIAWARSLRGGQGPDAFVAVGGGSVIDTTKVANLMCSYPGRELFDFVNAPIGKGLPIDKRLSPLIALPTTAGTGSEVTGTAIFDVTDLQVKTGIASRALKPLLGIIDPLNTRTMPAQVHCSSGLDVLFHALESFTAIPYNERVPRPANPLQRPAYQGRNPISDVFSLFALKETIEFLPRAVRDREDYEAQSRMLLAAAFAGIGFGNAGVHLCHGLSYPISGLNKTLAKWRHPGYEGTGAPIVPHGISVALTGPAVFNFTAPSDPGRHLEAARLFGAETNGVSAEQAGPLLKEQITNFLDRLGDGKQMPRGLKAIGYGTKDIPALVKGTLPQRRVLDLAPSDVHEEELTKIIQDAMVF